MRLAAALLLCTAAAAAPSFCAASGWDIEFSEEFDGDSLNASRWTVLNATRENDSSCRDARCLASNVAVAGGALRLTARREASAWANFTTGAVNSQGKVFWNATPASPWRLCVSGALPGGGGAGAGLWPAFWLMPNDDSCWPDHGELDILEMINGDGIAHATCESRRFRRAPVRPGPRAAALTNNCATLTPNPKRRANPKQTDHTSPAGSRCTYKDESEGGERPIPNFGGFNEYAIEVRGDGSFSFVYNGATVHEYNVTKGLPLHQVPW
jgi:beta-glucanase (GH16 family)